MIGMMRRPGGVVVPGEGLCVIEEFMPGAGVYACPDGWVRAQLVGSPEFDLKTRVASVKAPRRLPIPQPGDTVRARVIEIRNNILAIAKIYEIEEYGRLASTFTGLLHISQVSTSFVKSLFDVVRIGDVIRARVLSRGPPYLISIRGKDYGVVLAFCSECLRPLLIRGFNLYCPACKKVERRKVAFRYYVKVRV